MNLLIPFTDLDLYFWGGTVASVVGSYVHRHRTPFRVHVTPIPSKEEIQVSIARRRFAVWPPSSKEYRPSQEIWDGRRYVNQTADYASIGTVSVGQENADEQIIETIVNAKHLVKQWSGKGEFHQLEKVAKRALKS